MTSYVLDASVAAKWVLPAKGEPLVEESTTLLNAFVTGQVNLSVPDLFWPEVGNVLWKSVRLGRIRERSAEQAIGWFAALGIPTSPTSPFIADALALSITLDRPIYDAIYLAMAIASGRSLITADERLVNAVGARLPVRWLGSIV